MDDNEFVGRAIGNAYRIQGRLGAGHFGTVFLAESITNSSIVAVKVFREDVDALSVQHEVQAHARLNHANIVPIYGYDTIGNRPLIIMMYANGGSLADYLTERGRIDVGEVIRYLSQVASGVHHAHGKGIVHRDIKPSNMLLHRSSESDVFRVMLSDFGTTVKAHSESSNFSTQVPKGTLRYMPAEQFEGRATVRSDVYSLGVVAYELLAARAPFVIEDGSWFDYYKAHAEDAVPFFSDVCPKRAAAAKLEPVIRVALEKNPVDRYASTKDFIDDLIRAHNGKPLSLRPLAPTQNQAKTRSAQVNELQLEAAISELEGRWRGSNAYRRSGAIRADFDILMREGVFSLLGRTSLIPEQILALSRLDDKRLEVERRITEGLVARRLRVGGLNAEDMEKVARAPALGATPDERLGKVERFIGEALTVRDLIHEGQAKGVVEYSFRERIKSAVPGSLVGIPAALYAYSSTLVGVMTVVDATMFSIGASVLGTVLLYGWNWLREPR